MADDHSQRTFRTNDPYNRGAASAGPTASGNDPLAELARLIGQTDPFSEFGRDNSRRAPAPQPAPVEQRPQPMAPAYATPAYGAPGYHSPAPTQPQAPQYQAHNHQQSFPGFERPAAAVPGYAGGNDQYRGGYDDQGHASAQQHAGDYETDAYYDDQQPLEGEQDYYDEGPAPRRRVGILAIAAILTLAVIGTAGAFGYRALFGSSGTHMPPPVIKADTAPSKIVPSSANDQKSSGGKVIYDRVGDRGQAEKLVSREEAPIGINDKPTGVIAPPQESNGAATAAMQALAGEPNSTEPKRIHTISIRPDQPDMGLPPPAATTPSAPPQPSSSVPPRVVAPSRVASAQPSQAASEALPHRQAPPQHVAPPVRHAEAAPSNAPLSLSPNGNAGLPPPPSVPRAPVRIASAPSQTQAAPARRAAAPAGTGRGGYVQVSSQRSEADAENSFRALQSKYPKQLGGRQPVIHKADLGAKGVYYRALIGPFASAGEATELCASLKAAGGSCLIQRN